MKNRKFLAKFLTCTVAPALIPTVLLLPKQHFSEIACYILLSILFLIDVIFMCRFYRDSEIDKERLLTNKINSIAYTNAYQLSEKKRDYIIQKSYTGTYKLSEEAIPYDIFNYISEICKNFRDTISQITSIKQEYMSVTFIYHYNYETANDEDLSWRWIVGKESSMRTPLDYFVERNGSLYNYLIKSNDGKINSVFSNDKKQLAYKGRYYMSARDDDHNQIGSVFAVKVPFGNNAENFVEGVLLVSSYGKKFVDNSSEYSEEELKNLIFEDLYPYYQRLLETELGMLYLRHKKREER